MAYRFERGETVPEGTRRITIEQIHRALNHLGDADGDREEHIHESRKCMKRLRGLVRLVRAELGDETYRRENECFRDVSSILAGMRNAAALIEALDELLAWLGPRTPRSRFDNIRRWLIGRRDEAYGQSRPVDVRVEERAMSALSDAEKRLGSWSFSRDGFEALERGLRQVYARGRREYGEVQWRPAATVMHEWRKRVKYQWYHTQILRDTWPALMEVAEKELDQLGDLLGKDHDLAILSETVRGEFPRAKATSTIRALEHRVAERRASYHNECLVLGQRIYAERPTAFVRRLDGYWRSWVEEQIQQGTLAARPSEPSIPAAARSTVSDGD